MLSMRYKTTSMFVCVALGLLTPGCDDGPEDQAGVPWIPGDADPTEAAGGSSSESDSASSWGDSADDSDTADSAGSDSDTADSGEDDSVGDDSEGGSSSGGDSAGETSGGDSDSAGAGGDSPYAGGWDVGACDDASGPGDAIVGTDQNGDSVYLRDFCHKAVLLVLGNFT